MVFVRWNRLKHTLLSMVLFSGWFGLIAPLQAEPLKVVATTGMIGDLVENIGGDQIALEVLMGPGVDPHLYKATQGDLRRLQRADVIFYNGLHLEGRMQDVFEKMARFKTVVAVTHEMKKNTLIEADGGTDPHVWLDLDLWRQAGQAVLATLKSKRPQQSSRLEEQAEAYFAQLAELDAWVQAQTDTIPASQRVLITSHDAFGYFGRAYGLEVRGLQGLSTATEFGLNDIKRLKDLVIERQIKAVFVETSVSEKFLRSLVEGVKESGHPLRIGGKLYSDAMGMPGTPEGTYLGMVRHNVATLVQALK
ncbi:MAG: zinc ABC transporter substrate-binding protein [Hydrogenovibrio sp.]|uniref:metal ABC transporter solute-binding protein, Zn/Mn family n=1 Tax=Hydrogenovibrio sp. TaxID=2065821 RepID=UPI0028701F9B|nr:zinc ABC transporter substrate-binding protein [Hydrogenovibrio sp.]MDR9498772.1 zinc ABC transporter substrate-binding protein [Hydrogenovibrio sp.]